MRSVVSYDGLEQLTTTPTPGPPPAKKRKRQQNKRKPPQRFAHWDEPAEYHDVTLMNHETGEFEEEITDVESRELAHEEIWDDSALIKAWDAAMDEYRAFHGPEKGWKAEPISKPSPLWYNVPPSSCATGAGSEPLSSVHEQQEGSSARVLEHDSTPLNFNTFVPSHDPVLSNLAATDTQNLTSTSQDEAFKNALNAMYWTGYWTAVYHRRSAPGQPTPGEVDDVELGEDEAESPNVGGTVGGFVTSQR